MMISRVDITSLSSVRYFLTIVDDHSKSTWIYLMKHKSYTGNILINFINMVETQFDSKMKTIRCDNGPEFRLENFQVQRAIVYQTSCINTAQQNGVVKRKHRHLLNMEHVFLIQAGFPNYF